MRFAAITLLALTFACGPVSAAAPATGETAVTDHAHDFDFLVGTWGVHHRRLKARLAGSHDWVEFEGTSRFWTTLEGRGNVDDNFIGLPGESYRAMSVRGYDPKTQTWAIWWLDGRNPHKIEPPVIGNFQNGIGAFEGDDTFEGRPIKVRYLWSGITANSARWEQAFSPDGGKSWETNWVMDFTRVK
jgi:hypothetical protein